MSLHDRIHAALGRRTYRSISELTGINAETVRRYMQGQAPSAEFLTSLCKNLDLNAHWLLTGEGPMRLSEQRREALREADPSELLSAVASALEGLTERDDRIETFVQTLEARVSSKSVGPGGGEGENPHGESKNTQSRGGRGSRSRAGRVADALPKRSSKNAR
mgnify:CR=1 FL=1